MFQVRCYRLLCTGYIHHCIYVTDYLFYWSQIIYQSKINLIYCSQTVFIQTRSKTNTITTRTTTCTTISKTTAKQPQKSQAPSPPKPPPQQKNPKPYSDLVCMLSTLPLFAASKSIDIRETSSEIKLGQRWKELMCEEREISILIEYLSFA